MGVVTPTDFEKNIKSGDIKNIYYLYGRDTGRTAKYSVMVKKKVLGQKYSSSDYSKLDGKDLDMSTFSDLAEMYPMMSDYNLIEINDLDAGSLNADDLKTFVKLIESLPSQTVLLIPVTGFDVKAGKKAPDAKNKKIIDATAKVGIVVESELRKVSELYRYITEIAADNGKVISRQNAEKLAEMCLGNTLVVENEMGKLCSYADGEEITTEQIEQMVSPALDTNAFALASAVSSFNSVQAIKILDELVQQRTEGVVIISALSSAFIDMYRAAAAIGSSVRENEVASDFSYRGREFVVRNAFRDARKTTVQHLRRCLDILCSADLECKSTRLDQKIIIEKAISQMLSLRNEV